MKSKQSKDSKRKQSAFCNQEGIMRKSDSKLKIYKNFRRGLRVMKHVIKTTKALNDLKKILSRISGWPVKQAAK